MTLIPLLSGFVAMIAFALQTSLYVRAGQTALLVIMAALSSRRFRPVPAIIALIGVTLTNLFVPNGRVLFSFLSLRVTEGALELGLMKGLLLVGLVFLSRVSVRPTGRLPGALGWVIFRMFSYFEYLSESWKSTKGPFLQRLDSLLIDARSVNPDNQSLSSSSSEKPGAKRSIVFAVVVIVICWGPYLWPI